MKSLNNCLKDLLNLPSAIEAVSRPDAILRSCFVGIRVKIAVTLLLFGGIAHMWDMVCRYLQPCVRLTSSRAAQMPGEGPEEALTPTWQLQTKRALSDLWNLSELEESRKRSAPGDNSHMRLSPNANLISSEPMSDPLDATDPSMDHCLQ